MTACFRLFFSIFTNYAEVLNIDKDYRFIKETLIKSFDMLRMNGKVLIPLMLSLSNLECNQPVQGLLKKLKFSKLMLRNETLMASLSYSIPIERCFTIKWLKFIRYQEISCCLLFRFEKS